VTQMVERVTTPAVFRTLLSRHIQIDLLNPQRNERDSRPAAAPSSRLITGPQVGWAPNISGFPKMVVSLLQVLLDSFVYFTLRLLFFPHSSRSFILSVHPSIVSAFSTLIYRKISLPHSLNMAEKPLGFGYQVGAGAIAGVSEVGYYCSNLCWCDY
jgi:hypothetical protein